MSTASRNLRFGLALAVVAAAYFIRLDRPLLWGDEAHTAAMARGILHSGLPSAFDGRNLLLFDIRAGLNRHLVSREVPWIQWYVGAISMALFGQSAAGLRALFAFIGVLAFVPLWAALRRRVKLPEVAAALALIAPQAVLFDRNARYYPILVFLFACLVWHLTTDFRSPRTRFALATLIFVLLFHTHNLVAFCIAAALGIHLAIFRRRDLRCYMGAAAIAFATWLAWYLAMGAPLTHSPLYQTWGPVRNFGDWCRVFLQSQESMAIDLDVTGCLPLLLLGAIAGIFLARDRKGLWTLCADPLFGFVLIAIVVQSVATGSVSGTETEQKLAVLRYMPHFAVFGLVACYVALDRLVTSPAAFAALCAVPVACNLASFSFWLKPLGRQVPVSWFAPVYADILNPRPEALDGVVAYLDKRAPPLGEGDRAVLAVPPWTQATLIFYLGDRYIIPPDYLYQPGSHEDQGDSCVRATLGEKDYARLYSHPMWLLDSLGVIQTVPDGLVAEAFFPSYRDRPDDGARPELTRHTFFQNRPVLPMTLYRWVAP